MEIAFHMTKEETVSYADAKVEVCLRDEGKLLKKVAFPVSGQFAGAFKIAESVTLWSCENPKLYQVEIRIFDGQGNLMEVIPYPVGFRIIGLENGIIKLNRETHREWGIMRASDLMLVWHPLFMKFIEK